MSTGTPGLLILDSASLALVVSALVTVAVTVTSLKDVTVGLVSSMRSLCSSDRSVIVECRVTVTVLFAFALLVMVDEEAVELSVDDAEAVAEPTCSEEVDEGLAVDAGVLAAATMDGADCKELTADEDKVVEDESAMLSNSAEGL